MSENVRNRTLVAGISWVKLLFLGFEENRKKTENSDFEILLSLTPDVAFGTGTSAFRLLLIDFMALSLASDQARLDSSAFGSGSASWLLIQDLLVTTLIFSPDPHMYDNRLS